MKRLIRYFLLLLVIMGCTSKGKYTVMRTGLDSINMLNRTDQPFTTANVEPYVHFFDNHGNPNDRMLAYYLLGRAYYEHGEAPMALKCYQDAIEHSDTTREDCDYAQLSRVYAQIAEIFYQQRLPHVEKYLDNAIHYALISGDTLAAMIDYEQKANSYEQKGNPDSALIVIDSLINWYSSHGYKQDAAISCGRAFSVLITLRQYDAASKYLQEYEEYSGFFNTDGTIVQGREIFYYFKALFLMNCQQFDLAEKWLRKELHDGKDFNNQNSASKGLALLYQMRLLPDSVAKYALYSYDMNDSVYASMTTREIEQMQAMYSYSRNQELAKRQTELASHEKSVKEFVLFVLSLVCIFSYLIIRKLYKKNKEKQRKYKEGLTLIARMQSEILLLRQHEHEYDKLISEKEKQIKAHKQEIKKYQKSRISTDAERRLQDSADYQQLMKLANKGQAPTEEEWQRIYMLIIEFLPAFNDFIISTRHRLNIKEYNTCILLRLHLKNQAISHMLLVSPPYISKICSEMMQKLFNEKGNTKDLIEKLNEIF